MSSASGDKSIGDVSSFSWRDLQKMVDATPVGSALNKERIQQLAGDGPPNVHNKLRVFGLDGEPSITIYRDRNES
jgi:hypothetical protein